ncbi:hypothetical protein RJ639_034970 [Escallonia herrerae]|uniref:Uncharacterized protein n=1 Tax=Escallonia herrerae TaxID=1293975 RepID=A0AA89B8H0_9ASTE|nr:hypothetical protein RJ639_034970 [Escallonia herrerae]
MFTTLLLLLLCRKRYPGNCTQLSLVKACGFGALRTGTVKTSPYKKSFMKCCCLGTLVNADIAVTSDWVTVVNQALLMGSIFLTYMAGVIPVEKSRLSNQKGISSGCAVPEETSFSGSGTNNDDEISFGFAWDIVKGKLMDTLDAIGRGGDLGNKGFEHEQKQPSSLYAVAEGPRFRLLWASYQWLNNEAGTWSITNVYHNMTLSSFLFLVKVDNISGKSDTLSPLNVFSEIIQKSYQSVSTGWLKEELCLRNSNCDKALLSTMVEKLNGYDSILQNIKKLGKEDLYAELICVLRFGSLRQDCCYDYSFFTIHGVSLLEDLVITLADGIASMYVELISVDGNMSNEMNRLGLSLCTLSTRALQRLRNEVVLSQWLYQNMEAVASMYEDRFDLRTLQTRPVEEPRKSETDNFSWWKKLSMRESLPESSPSRFAVISYISVPVKRTRELRALTGWSRRYYYSLFLELTDITMPLIRTVFAKVSDAVSFFLVYLIGRSLGLICTGIRQSLRWK